MCSRNGLGPSERPFPFWAAIGATVLLAACENPQPPVMCGAIPDQTVVVGDRATVSACFEDPNGDVLSFYAASSDVGIATVSVSGSTLTVTAVSPGTSVITVTATDVTQLSGDQQFRVLVPNRAPVAIGEIAAREVPSGESASVDVSAHFMEPDGQPLTYAMAISDESVLGIAATGAVVTLEALAKGSATVTATATDPGGLSAVQSFLVTVPNRTPGAVGTIAPQTIEVDAAATIDMTGYFTDPDGDDLAYLAASSDPSVTEVSISGGELTVTAVAKGEATVTVTATDTEELTATQEFVVTVPNRAPLAVGSIEERTIEVDETSSLELSGYFSDPDGDVLVYSVAISDAAVAGVEVSGGALAVTAVAKGTATVTVTATDIDGLTATHAFGVTVPNRPPVVAGSIESRTIEVGEAASLDLSNHFSDPDGDVLVYTAAASDAAVAGAAVEGEAMTVTAVAKGEATVTVTATDTEGLTVTQAFLVTVPNRPPLAVASIEERTLEVGQSAVLALPGYFEDPDGDALAYAVSSSDATLIGASVEGSDLTVTAVARGDAAVTVTATDTEGRTATQTFAVTVPNQPPLATGSIEGQTIEVDETAAMDLSSYFTEPDGDGLTYSAVISDGAVAGVEVSGGTLTVTAITKGVATVTVTGTDTDGLTATQEFVVTVPNRPPLAAGTIEARTIEVDETADLDLSSYFSDPDGDALAYTAAASDAAVAGAGVEGAAMTVTAVAKGEATVTVTATDTEGLTATQAFVVAVPNRPPHATGSIAERTLAVGQSTVLELPGYFEDPDGDDLTYSVSSSDATLIGASVESAVVTVEALAKGQAVVTVTATDREGLAATQEFAVAVANQPPQAVGSIEGQTVEVGQSSTMELPGYFEDPDDDALAYVAVTLEESVIAVSVSGGTVTVVGRQKGEAPVIVMATDTEGMTAVQEFTVTVPNRAPLAVGTVEPMEMSEGGTTRLDPSPLFADPDGDALALSAESSRPQIAKAWVASNGILVRGAKKGTATVTITAEDTEGLATTLRFNVRVKGSGGSDPNQPPVVVGNIPTQNLEEGDSRMVDVSSYFSDPDDDELEFRAGSSDPEVVEATVSGDEVDLQVTGTGTATVTVTAEDPEGLDASTAFAVAVVEATDENRAPVVVGNIPTQNLEEGDSRMVDVSSYFSDPDDDELEFRAGSSDPEVVEATVSGDEVDLQVTGTGTATVTVTAEDPEGLEASTAFAVAVVEATDDSDNKAPTVIRVVDNRTLLVDTAHLMQPWKHFEDPDDNYDDLTFTATSSNSDIISVEVLPSTLIWSSSMESLGQATVTVTARDPDGLTAELSFVLTVGNNAPTVKKGPDDILSSPAEIDTVKMYSTFKDGDIGERLSYSASSSNTDVVAASIAFSNVYGYYVRVRGVAVGDATVTVTATDLGGLKAETTVSVTVHSNRPPRLETEIPDETVGSDETVVVILSRYFSDPDGDDLTYTAAAGPWYDVSISADTLTLVPTETTGIAIVLATATDPGGRYVEDYFFIRNAGDQQQQSSSADGPTGNPVFAAAPDPVRSGTRTATGLQALNPPRASPRWPGSNQHR